MGNVFIFPFLIWVFNFQEPLLCITFCTVLWKSTVQLCLCVVRPMLLALGGGNLWVLQPILQSYYVRWWCAACFTHNRADQNSCIYFEKRFAITVKDRVCISCCCLFNEAFIIKCCTDNDTKSTFMSLFLYQNFFSSRKPSRDLLNTAFSPLFRDFH